MIKVSFDFAELSAFALALGASENQIPFAMATALNRAADVVRTHLIKSTWPTHIKQRNASFIAASLTTKDARASKQSLAVEIYDRLNRGNLQKQAKGGVRVPKGGGTLAVPSSTAVTRGAHGVPKAMRPRNLKNSFKQKGMLFTRDRKGRARLIYALKPVTRIPKRVPFYEDFNRMMRVELGRQIPMAVARAMTTARGRRR